MMSSAGTRQRVLYARRPSGREITTAEWRGEGGQVKPPTENGETAVGKQITVSESHVRDRNGSYREGGPFYTSRIEEIVSRPYVKDIYHQTVSKVFSGPISGGLPTQEEMSKLGYSNPKLDKFGDKNESSMVKDGTVAIALTSPTNPASDLGTTLAESMREGIPSIPGIQSWKARTKILKGLGSEYLNYQFGWAPLVDEVSAVRDAARHHRDLLSQYHRGEGSDTHRRFDFPSQSSTSSLPEVSEWSKWPLLPFAWSPGNGTRQVRRISRTKRWFEGVFTYALPSSTDSWRRALGFGSDADQLFGIALNPEILWELTPWSWAVDWFSNTGFVIQNVTSFGLAGLVMRYGYMMEESIDEVVAEGRLPTFDHVYKNPENPEGIIIKRGGSKGSYRVGYKTTTKRRIPASPFGFGIGWEGLSPTQLAITAALGITRLL